MVRPDAMMTWWKSLTRKEKLHWAFTEAVGAVIFILALRSMSFHMTEAVGFYDEGILLTDPHLILMGKIPYRDFYTNYPPGIFLVIAALFKVLGPSVMVERGLALFIRLALALGAGRLVGRMTGTPLSMVAAGVVLTWLVPVPIAAFAWLMALTISLWATEFFVWSQGRSARIRALAGVFIGMVSWFRHDMFTYWGVLLTVGLLGWAAISARWRNDRTVLPNMLPTVLGIIAAVVIFWVPVLLLGGISQTAHDLYFDQVKYVLPARWLPFPTSWNEEVLMAALVLAFIGPVLGLVTTGLSFMGKVKHKAAAGLVAALSVGLLPQMMGRTDEAHVIYTIAPALIFGTVLAMISYRPMQWVLVGLMLWPVASRLREKPPERTFITHPLLEREFGIQEEDSSPRAQVVEFIQKQTRPDEPIYVGMMDHSSIVVNELDLYFVANRLGSTRYMQFDPNVVNREDVQRAMIEQLERAPTRVAVLSVKGNFGNEPNDSSKRGSPLLTQYFQDNFELALRVGPYAVLMRK